LRVCVRVPERFNAYFAFQREARTRAHARAYARARAVAPVGNRRKRFAPL